MKTTSNFLAVAGLLALAFCIIVLMRGKLFQADATRRFTGELPTTAGPVYTAPQPKTTAPLMPARGLAIALLAIPRLDLSTVVVEGADEPELKLAPGHIPGTSMPGKGGNVAVAGHRDTFFRPLRLIRMNDTITVRTHDREFQYRVVSTEIVSPKDVRVLNPTGHETLTLVTCYPFYFVGSAPSRFIVHADCVNCTK
jgi:sortase A